MDYNEKWELLGWWTVLYPNYGADHMINVVLKNKELYTKKGELNYM